jgi:xylulokinase
MLLLGIDLGTSSIKVSVVDAGTQQCLAFAQYPETETPILAPFPGWAEQDPAQWWVHIKKAILICHSQGKYDPGDIASIGIAYQMHGLVLIDKAGEVLRNSIIWCDSRAVEIGEKAFRQIGADTCFSRLLNSPGNFTASKLAWVKKNEPRLYEKIDQVLLPGDFIGRMFTGDTTTTASALSEGIFWDFESHGLSLDVIRYFDFDTSFFPSIRPVFSSHGELLGTVARDLKLRKGIPVAYKAGDQLNNALLLNVLEPGELAATAGTSGVIYGVSDQLTFDRQSRINSFAHVNHRAGRNRVGVLLCINGTGIFNRWIRNLVGKDSSYDEWNKRAAEIAPGSEGLLAIPFGNGAERMLNNQVVGGHLHQLDLNVHGPAHMVRASNFISGIPGKNSFTPVVIAMYDYF